MLFFFLYVIDLLGLQYALEEKFSEYLNLTFRGPCIVMNSYNKS